MLPSIPVRARLAMSLLGLSSLITSLDFTIVYVALPDIDHQLGFGAGQVQWVVSAYALAFGGFLLLCGRLSDLLGRRRTFVFGMLLFAAASLLGTFAGGQAALLAARALQGLGAAALFPSTLSLVTAMFPEGPARARAMTVWATCGASGLSLGALLGESSPRSTGAASCSSTSRSPCSPPQARSRRWPRMRPCCARAGST
jgi:MFS family permease